MGEKLRRGGKAAERGESSRLAMVRRGKDKGGM